MANSSQIKDSNALELKMMRTSASGGDNTLPVGMARHPKFARDEPSQCSAQLRLVLPKSRLMNHHVRQPGQQRHRQQRLETGATQLGSVHRY